MLIVKGPIELGRLRAPWTMFLIGCGPKGGS